MRRAAVGRSHGDVRHVGRPGDSLPQSRQADAILLDLQLPGIKGLAIARQCREEPATCHIPIVAVTAFSSAYERADAVKAGCDAYLGKPLDEVELQRLLLRHGLKAPKDESAAQA